MSNYGSPYKFLDPYELEDAHLFFGREVETKILMADILTTRLVLVFAKTGTGKTSLINAGVRPVLHERGYQTCFIRVQKDPVQSARLAIEQQLGRSLPAGVGFAEQLESLVRDQPVVLFFDQFEEFFLYVAREDPGKAREFVADLAQLAEAQSSDDGERSDLHLVFSMREEFLAEMEIFREDVPTIFGADSNLRLRWFTPSQAAEAIERPAAAADFGASVEPELVRRVVSELTAIGLSIPGTSAETPIEPAQLQMVCDTLWRERENGTLTLGRYLALGRPGHTESVARQILDQRLVEEFEQLETEHELELLWRLLPELHTPGGTKWVRELAELARTIGTDEPTLRGLLDKLHRSGFVDVVSHDGSDFVELVHDYLADPRRVDVLRRSVRTVWPRRLLREGVRAFDETEMLLPADDVAKVVEHLDELRLSPVEGELLLRSALHDVATDVSKITVAIERSGAAMWSILAERLEHADGAESLHIIETLARMDRREAHDLLQDSLGDDDATAQRIVGVLGSVETALSVELLERALTRAGLRSHAQEALSRLASSWGSHAVAQTAADVLAAALATEAVSPEVEETLLSLSASRHVAIAGRALPLLGKVEQVRAVRILERALENPSLTDVARSALWELTRSGRSEVSRAAGSALGETSRAARSPQAPAPQPLPGDSWPGVGDEIDRAPSGRAVGEHELERHLRVVATAIAAGRVIPFLGAGANTVGRPVDARWERDTYLPTGLELSYHLAERSAYPEGEPIDLPRVAQYVAWTMGSGYLYHELRSIFSGSYAVTPLHEFLATMPAMLYQRGASPSHQLILTANFDDSLERAFDAAGEPYDLLVYTAVGEYAGLYSHTPPGGPPRLIERPERYLELSPDERTVIVKLHGSVDRYDERFDSFVVTEDDFVDYLARSDLSKNMPVTILSRLARSSFLFLGYTLRDWTLRTILHRIWREQRRDLKSWAVLRDPSALDQLFWRARRVDVVDVPLEDYAHGLRAVLANEL